MKKYEFPTSMSDKQGRLFTAARELEKSGKIAAAVEKYIELGNSGFTRAFYSAALRLEYGEGDLKSNRLLALKYYELALESDRQAEAVHSIAGIYSMEGYCDIDKALKYYKYLSDLDDPLSQLGHFRLGVIFYSEGHAGKTDLEKAIYHFRCSARMGNSWAFQALATIESRSGNRIRAFLLRTRSYILRVKYVCFDPTNPGIRSL